MYTSIVLVSLRCRESLFSRVVCKGIARVVALAPLGAALRALQLLLDILLPFVQLIE